MKTKLLGMLAIMLGVFLCTGVAAASDVTTLQPASDIIYNENVDINGSLNTDSLRVGTAGLGGVTFFNGSVLNEGATDPFTIADDMRVDGEIWRGVKGGDPIKISDNVIPTMNYTNDLGDSNHRWRNFYTQNARFDGNVNFDSAIIQGNLNIEGNIAPATDREFNIGTEEVKYEKIWTDQADIRQTSISQLFLYNQVNGEPEGYISDWGDDYSIGIQGTKGNIVIKAVNGNNVASLELAEKTTLKFTPRTSAPYSCNATHEGEMYYDSSNSTSHKMVVCSWNNATGYSWNEL